MQLCANEKKSILMQINRTHNIEDLNSGMIGQKVILGGWVEDL